MSQPAIRATHLAKRYRIGHRRAYETLRERLVRAFRSPLDRLRGRAGRDGASEILWALDGVSFDVQPGEVVGIIGRNGAGKSTLLKILSRITEPTRGELELRGRVGALLELGTGFHPELTGRENVYLSGAVLGMKRAEIREAFDAIVAFAEIERFIDTPVKRYSSGMYVRLGFAIAAHLNPEILLVDEVLAVGDASFQKKCLCKVREVSGAGRTVLFVSHNLTAVTALCQRVLWLDAGRVRADGDAKSVVASYLTAGVGRGSRERAWADPSQAPGVDQVRLRRVLIRPEVVGPQDAITVHTPFLLEFEYWNFAPGLILNLSVSVVNDQGVVVFNTVPSREKVWNGRPFPVGLFRSRFRVPGDLMNDGTYRVSLYLVRDQSVVLTRIDDLIEFEIADSSTDRAAWYSRWEGTVRPILGWETELLDEAAPASVEPALAGAGSALVSPATPDNNVIK